MSARQAAGYAAFRSRDFRLFSASRFLALFGLQMQNVAVGWLVYELTRSAWVLCPNLFRRVEPTRAESSHNSPTNFYCAIGSRL